MINGAISVIIPAYNRAGLIGETLRSLLNQTLPAAEIIVVDDGSTDGTAETFLEMLKLGNAEKLKISGGKPWPEFKVIRQANAGPGAARNRGFAESKGEFIHFFDSDDIAAPNKHEVQVHALQESGADIAYGPWVKGYIKERGGWRVERGARGEGERDPEEHAERHYSFEPEGHVLQQKELPKGDLIEELLTRWSIVPQACMFRRSIVEKSGGFPDDMFVAEDQLMFLRCLLARARVVHTPQTLAFYRLGDAGKLTESAEGYRRRITDWAVFLERSRSECEARAIIPDKWIGFRMRLRTAQRERAALPESCQTMPLFVGDFAFGAIAALQKWWGGLKVRLTGNRQNVSFHCGRITREQLELFPRT
jgi:glycosyltransferase involved in cell wall biosynthesis